jgi:hypothetical protein
MAANLTESIVRLPMYFVARFIRWEERDNHTLLSEWGLPLLAILRLVGMDLEPVAQGLALVLLIVYTLLAMHVGERLSTGLGSLIAGDISANQLFFRDTALDGMEPALSDPNAQFLGGCACSRAR